MSLQLIMRIVALLDEQGEIWPCLGPGGGWGGAPGLVGCGGGGAVLSLRVCGCGRALCAFTCCWAVLIHGCVWRTCSKWFSSSFPGLFTQLR